MTTANEGELLCPQCGHSNPAKADYCWECRHDFVHDERLKAAPRPAPPPPRPAKIPPPYSTPQPEVKKPREHVSLYAFAVELLVSTIIVGGSWALLRFALPDLSVLWFALGWAGALFLVMISEGVLPDPETDLTRYYSWNPFQYRDDMNRKVLATHLWLFLPRIVLRTIRRGFSVLFAR